MKTSKIFFSLVSLLVLIPSLGFSELLERPSTSERVVEYFKNHDIDIQVYPPVFPVLVGELNFFGKLDNFWKVLDLRKEDIVKRAESIETLIISTYTTVNFDNSTLTLDVNNDDRTLRRYLPLIDIKRDIRESIDVEIRTGMVDLHSPKEKDFEVFSELMEFLISRRNQIDDLSGIIREIDITGGSDFLLLQYGKMNLSVGNYLEAFDQYGLLAFLSLKNPQKLRFALVLIWRGKRRESSLTESLMP